MPPPVTAILLAGGPGTRFGGPKALASFGDDNCATLALRKLLAAQLAQVIVVTGASAAEVRESLERNRLTGAAGLLVLADPGWERGPGSGLALGLSRADPASIAALVLPVHYPFVGEETLALLSQLFAQEPAAAGKVMVPLHESRMGFPILVGRELFHELGSSASDDPVMELARAVPGRVIGVAVDDPGTQFCIETRDDYLRALQLLSEEEFDDER